MKRGEFKRKPSPQAQEHRHRLSVPKKVHVARTIAKKGKVGLLWDMLRGKVVKPAFMRAGITTCEFGYDGCWRDNNLGFAHSKKRRNCSSVHDLLDVALACNSCHDKIEAMSHEEMAALVRGAQARRRIPVQFDIMLASSIKKD